jgi:hypothetical protein
MQSENQVILQLDISPELWCAGFRWVAVTKRAFITIASAWSPTAQQVARTLRDKLVQHLLQLGLNVAMDAIRDCHSAQESAFADNDVQKLLIWVGDSVSGLQPVPREPFHSRMLVRDPLWSVLPVFNRMDRSGIARLLSPEYQHLNVAFYKNPADLTEVVPAGFASARLTAARPRLFISYRQNETAALAVQLFDALAHQGFDPFLDHFRIPPGVDFQSRLTQEMGDKSVVVVLESPSILDSPWTLYEINTARKWRLGLFAVNVPGGKKVPGIDDTARYFVYPHHLRGPEQGNGFSASTALNDEWLAHLVDWIRTEHDRVLAYRKEYLRNTMVEALQISGAPPGTTQVDPTGVVYVSSPVRAMDYMIWLATRPPEVTDFFAVHSRCKAPDRGVLVGLSELMERDRRQVHDWLGGVCGLVSVDEGRMLEAATRIVKGML